MAFQDLVRNDCGRNNPLTELTSHFLLDQAHEDHGLYPLNTTGDDISNAETDQLVQQYLQEVYGQKTQSFCMDSLFQELTKIESVELSQVPVQNELPVADNPNFGALDSVWVQEYLEAGKPFKAEFNEDNEDQGGNTWKATSYGPDMQGAFHSEVNSSWTWNYFAVNEQNIDIDENWSQETEPNDENQGSLQKLASLFIHSVDDPKLKSSKFMKFMQHVENGDISICGGQVIDHFKTRVDGGSVTINSEELNDLGICLPNIGEYSVRAGENLQ